MKQRSKYAILSVLLAALCGTASASAPQERILLFGTGSPGQGSVTWDPAAAREARDRGERFVAAGFPLAPGLSVDLDLEPFAVTSRDTRFVVGRKDGPDRVLDFDPSSLMLFRGRVLGRPGSQVMLVLGESLSTGWVQLEGRRFLISSKGEDGSPLESGKLSVFEGTSRPTGKPPDVPLCGVTDEHPDAPVPLGAPPIPAVGYRHLELAVDTDYEYFLLFEDLDAAAAYTVALYATVSDIYLRDMGTWVDLVFVRLWDDPDDLFNDVEPSPLGDFRAHWEDHMGSVQRDVAQLVSGRWDYPFGGQAYLATLCSSSAYGVVGYILGSFPEPAVPSVYHYDIFVTAHELGHNAGALHTQDYGIDTCHTADEDPRRGSIMSYCTQTWSGGNANGDNRFHTTVQPNIESHVAASSCVVADCNLNGIDDATDIQQSVGGDIDGNGIPDECEDCNDNDVLDDEDISLGTSLDLNGNGVPDECEPDCDANDIPDDKQIADGLSNDLHGNGIPDECEPDCNLNSISDYTEIIADMTLDVDRDTILDACQDCDTDGTPDLSELGGGHSLWITSGLSGSDLRQFHSVTGVLMQTSQTGGGADIAQGRDLIATPSGRILVTSALDSTVKEFDRNGNFQGNLVGSGSGGLLDPGGLILTPRGTLLVASRDTHAVLEYDASTGASLGAFIGPGTSPLTSPFGMTIGPDGELYVTSATNEVLRYDLANGTYLDTFVGSAANAGLDVPRGLVFKADGNLLVASFGTDEVLEYEGDDGAPLGKWAQVGTATRLTQTSPWGIRVGPNGNVFVARTGEDFGSGSLSADDHDHDETDIVGELHLTDARTYEYDIRTGGFIRAHVTGLDHNLEFAAGFDFVPGWAIDCNFNMIQDSCDIASGTSQDSDASGVPDECEIDCNANGTLDRLDIIPFGASRDCNHNLTPDECDLSSGASNDCTQNGIPDECEADCNGNGVADSCDIQAGTSTDCNVNDVPDECDAAIDFESAAGWTVGAPGDDANDGIWTRVNPVGTAAQPEYDHTAGAGRTCWVTGQGGFGGSDTAADVDGGTTTLISSTIDLSSHPDPHIGYWRWFSNDAGQNPGEDVFRVDVSDDDGGSWNNVETVGPGGAQASGGWFFHAFRVADHVTPTATVKLRFVAQDTGGGSIVEAAIDDVVLLPFCCQGAASCDDGRSCTLDSCALSGQCEYANAPGECWIGDACYTDGQSNPGNLCELCDATEPNDWAPALPLEVDGVVLTSGPTTLSWSPQAGAVYDVVSGGVLALHTGDGVAFAACLENDVAGIVWQDTRPDPAADAGYYYLVRAEDSCGTGSWGTGSQGAPRQPLFDCP